MNEGQPARRYRAMFFEPFGTLADGPSDGGRPAGLLPGARELLDAVSGTGLHMGLIAGTGTRNLDSTLGRLGIDRVFDSRTTAGDVGAAGPDMRTFRAALKKAGCEPRQAIFVAGSIGRGIGGAKAAGMTTVLLDAGMSQGELEDADFVASSPARLVKILMELAYTGVPAD
jgi:FMN phosphatase YigB (HAD superfamily)